jgi:hypothetical protein
MITFTIMATVTSDIVVAALALKHHANRSAAHQSAANRPLVRDAHLTNRTVRV